MKKYQKTLQKIAAIAAALALNLAFVPVYAASLTSVSDTLSRIKISTASNHTIKFTTPSGIHSGDTITLTFPASSFTMGASLTGVTIADGGGADNAVTSANWSAPTLTITASGTSTVTAGNVATIKIPSAQITSPGSVNTYVISIAGSFGDTGSIAVAVIADDQFTVAAMIDPSITFTLNKTAVSLGALSVSSVSTDTTSFTVNTNAVSGYTTTVTEDGNLRYSANDINDVADGTVTAGSEEYGMSTSKAGQTIVATSGNNATAIDGTNKACASASGPVSSDITTLTLLASMAGSTPAGAYFHTVTVLATANF